MSRAINFVGKYGIVKKFVEQIGQLLPVLQPGVGAGHRMTAGANSAILLW